MHAHRKAVKRHTQITQMINRLDSYLSDTPHLRVFAGHRETSCFVR